MPHRAHQRRSGTDRRTTRRYRFLERRQGFDNRRRYPLLDPLRNNPWAVIGVIAVINALSMLDAYLTIRELSLGIAVEGNPVLDAVFRNHGPMEGVAFKTLAVLGVSVVIWLNRRRKAVLLIAIVALATFGGLAVYHWYHLQEFGIL